MRGFGGTRRWLTDLSTPRTGACSEGAGQEGLSRSWGTVEQDASWWRDDEPLEDFGIEKGEKGHLLESMDVYRTVSRSCME